MLQLLVISACYCAVHNSVVPDSIFGSPTIARFSGGAEGAVSLEFDDSMPSQAQNLLPLLNARGIHATFFVNPGANHYQAHKQAWEHDIPRAGHEVANHTFNHTGARNLEEAESQIALCSKSLAMIMGARARLVSFAIPGGVPWNVTPEQLKQILDRHLLVLSDRRNFFDEKQVDPITFAQVAVRQHTWMKISMHGIGGEWLSTSVPTVARLLDFVVANRGTLWTAPTIEVAKYEMERDAVAPLVLNHANTHGFTIQVNCDPTKLDTHGQPVARYYDQPLTVEISVPANWNSASVQQDHKSTSAKVLDIDGKRLLRFDALPNKAPVKVTAEK